MLAQLIVDHREELLSRARGMIAARLWPSAPTPELENGIPDFLSQVTETLRLERAGERFPDGSIGASAARNGGDLLGKGFSVSQVVHAYGDVCQAITELAARERAAVSPEEFHTLNRCLDTAIAEAVTEHGRLAVDATAHAEAERLGRLAHELRNLLQTALLAFGALKSGQVGVTGSTGAVLGRSLVSLRALVDTALAEARLASDAPRPTRVLLEPLLEELMTEARLHAECRGLALGLEPIDSELEVEVDPQLLASALMNLLQNAFKYTRAHGRVTLRARRLGERVLIEVEDQCGGLPGGVEGGAPRPDADRRRNARSGLGLGLTISRRAVRANGGELHARSLPGQGCIFGIELPVALTPARGETMRPGTRPDPDRAHGVGGPSPST